MVGLAWMYSQNARNKVDISWQLPSFSTLGLAWCSFNPLAAWLLSIVRGWTRRFFFPLSISIIFSLGRTKTSGEAALVSHSY
jgi:hypothetical protein